MKAGCVLDSDILIYHLNGELDDAEENLFLHKMKEGAHISIVSRIEILGWRGHTEDSLEAAHELLSRLTEHPLDAEIADICISLRQKYRIKLPDAVIAATALCTDLPLMTRNTADFNSISALKLLNPFEDEEERDAE